MTESCDLCRSPDLECIYEPWDSGRGLKVHLCTRCGLLQSLPKADRAPRQGAAVSSGADWGNVRYGKGFRTQACLSMLAAHADLKKPLKVLDVGSNRGAFARALTAAAAEAELTCVEPDERVAESCLGLPRTELVCARIEEANLPEFHYDVVHSCHTLEHLASPMTVLEQHWRQLKPGGYLILDVPNVALIAGDDMVEEWFIDKHLYHFSRTTLERFLAASGFAVVGGPDPDDYENLLIVARKRDLRRTCPHDPDEVDVALSRVTSYVLNRARNLAVLTHVAAEIAQLAPKGVALWGAGRLFDALVRHGGFDPNVLSLLIDTHLKSHVAERHGMPVSGPDALSEAKPAAIVVMSRAFSSEIARKAAEASPQAEILLYADLLARARTALAA